MPKEKDDQQALWLDVRYLDDHVLLTKSDAWTWLMVPGVNTSMPTREKINSIIRQVETVFDGLGREVEVHYHLAYRQINTSEWARRLDEAATAPTPAWDDYLTRMRTRMLEQDFHDRILYLGVRLGSRHTLVKPHLRGATPTQWIKGWVNAAVSAASGPDMQPGAEEVARWREVAAKTRIALGSSALGAFPARSKDVAWLIRHVQRLGMPEGATDLPGRTWGAGQVYSLAEAVTDNTDRTQLTVRLSGRNTMLPYQVAAAASGATSMQPEAAHVSHVAILPIGKMPDEIVDPWLFHASALPFPVEVSARFRVLSPEQAEKDAAKAALLQRNAVSDAVEAGNAVNRKDARRLGGATALHNEQAAGEGRRQIVGTYRLIVAAETREVVGARAEEVIRHFREDRGLGVTVEWPPGDQLALWEELLPGQLRRTKLYEQRQDLVTFAVGLPFSVTTAGDGEGPYIGTVMTGSPAPCLYDMATAAKRGKASTLALTGSLGGGKTFLLLTLMDHHRLRGYPLIALDPKGDIKGSLLLRGRGDARFFDLSTDGQPGTLDPFTLVPAGVDPSDPDRDTAQKADARWREETRTLVMDVLEQLLDTSDRMKTVVAMTLNYEMAQPRPTMAHFLAALAAGGAQPGPELGISDEVRSEYKMAALGAHAQLKNTSETQLGRLMFAPPGAGANSLFQGGVATTVVSLSGLDLPKDGKGPTNPSQRFSVALFSLVAHQARRMLLDLDYVGPRALIIDEAHQITSLPSGRSLIVSNARMGRSRDIALVLATQSTADLVGSDLRPVISAVFAFRATERQEREDVAVLLGREPDDEAIAQLLPGEGSPAGLCLMSWDGSVSLVQIDRWAKEYDVAFDTNPDRKNVSAAGTRIVTDQFGVVHDPDGPNARLAVPPSPVPAPARHAAAAPVPAAPAWSAPAAPELVPAGDSTRTSTAGSNGWWD